MNTLMISWMLERITISQQMSKLSATTTIGLGQCPTMSRMPSTKKLL